MFSTLTFERLLEKRYNTRFLGAVSCTLQSVYGLNYAWLLLQSRNVFEVVSF